MQSDITQEDFYKEFNLQEAKNQLRKQISLGKGKSEFFTPEVEKIFEEHNFQNSFSSKLLNELKDLNNFLKKDISELFKIEYFNFVINTTKPIFYFSNKHGNKINFNQNQEIECLFVLNDKSLKITMPIKNNNNTLVITYEDATLKFNQPAYGYYDNRRMERNHEININNKGNRLYAKNISEEVLTNTLNNIKEANTIEMMNSNLKLLKKICYHIELNIRSQDDVINFNDNFKKIPITRPEEFKDRMDIYYLLNDGVIPENKKQEIDKIMEETKKVNIELSNSKKV